MKMATEFATMPGPGEAMVRETALTLLMKMATEFATMPGPGTLATVAAGRWGAGRNKGIEAESRQSNNKITGASSSELAPIISNRRVSFQWPRPQGFLKTLGSSCEYKMNSYNFLGAILATCQNSKIMVK